MLGNRRLRDHGEAPPVGDGEVVADERLGWLLPSYRQWPVGLSPFPDSTLSKRRRSQAPVRC